MTPLNFGSGARRLLGLYQGAAAPASRARAVLFCHASGSEFVNSYRAVSFAAHRFAAAGFSTLRFDYYGTGDSQGDSIDSDLSGWEADIEAAMEELRELARVKSVALFGLRLGATLAARVAARAPAAVSRLILWDPVVDGAQYVEALSAKTRLRMSGAKLERTGASEPAGSRELDGLRVTPFFVSALRAIDRYPAPSELLARTLVVQTLVDRPARAPPAAPNGATPEGSAHLASFDPAPWVNDPGAALPLNTLEQIIEWMR